MIRYFVILAIAGGTLGGILGSLGASLASWQWWVGMLCLVVVTINNAFID